MLIYKFYFHLKKKNQHPTPPPALIFGTTPYVYHWKHRSKYQAEPLSQPRLQTPPPYISLKYTAPPPKKKNQANTKRREKYWYWFIWRSGCIVMIFFASTKQFVQQPTFYNMDSFHQVMSYNRIHFWDRLSYHKSCTLVMERL